MAVTWGGGQVGWNGGGSPGGTPGQIQYNADGAFAGVPNSRVSPGSIQLSTQATLDGNQLSMTSTELASDNTSGSFTASAELAYEDTQGYLNIGTSSAEIYSYSEGIQSTLSLTPATATTTSTNGTNTSTVTVIPASITLASLAVFIPGLPVYADQAAAVAGGLAVDQLYRTATGQVMVVYFEA